MRKLRWIGIFALLAFDKASAEEAPSVNFRCRTEPSDSVLSVSIGSSEYSLGEFVFPSTSFVSPAVYCQKWLTDTLSSPLPAGYPKHLDFEFAELVGTHETDKPIRLMGRLRNIFYASCVASPRCSLRFPFAFIGLQAKQWWSLASTPDESLTACEGAQIRRDSQLKHADDDIPRWSFSKTDTWWVTPVSSYVQPLLQELESGESTWVVASTMTVSTASLEAVAEVLKRRPKKKLFLFFSLPHAIVERDSVLLTGEFPPNLVFVPVFPTPDHPLHYHLKGFASEKGAYAFTAGNFTASASQVILDLGVSGQDPTKSSELARLFLDQGRRLCRQEKELSCFLEVAFDSESVERHHIREWISRACSILPQLQVPKGETALLRSDEWDLAAWMAAKIKGARKNVRAFTHQFDHPDVLDALARSSRQIPVSLMVGNAAARRAVRDRASEVKGLHLNNGELYLEPHSKGLLIDDEELILCSGNLTRNGLRESTEVCFSTRDPLAIAQLHKYLRTVADFVEPKASVLVEEPTTDCLSQDSTVFVPFGAQRKKPETIEVLKRLRPTKGIANDFLRAEQGEFNCCLAKEGPAFFRSLHHALECVSLPRNRSDSVTK